MLKEFLLNKKHHQYRKDFSLVFDKNMSIEERMVYRFEQVCEAETPVILPCEQICFMRTVKNLPEIISEKEWAEIKGKHFIHELGFCSNFTPDYGRIISSGLEKIREGADEYGKRMIDSILSLSERYRMEALKQGRDDIAEVLSVVPRHGATSFKEALQFFRIIHFSLWLEGNYHVTIGRFDKYMYPYLKADLDSGIQTEETALALLEDFFLSFNKDSDLYPGVQQGDNGQSMVLGGVDENGNEVFNILSELCLKASGENMMIDPKINLRVNKETPIEVFELGSRLTEKGLGFPQYSNDDVMIDALISNGYDEKDARDYTVAACWEFIIPGCGGDIANIGALSFPKLIDNCIHKHTDKETYEEFFEAVKMEMKLMCDDICGGINNLWFVPSPFKSLCMNEIKYHNFGIHGTGIATAVDSLYAVKKYVYDEKTISWDRLITAVDSDFENDPELLNLLRFKTDKMGNDVDEVDDISVKLLDGFSDALKGRKNCLGGEYRPGTGSAMYYLWHADEIGASPDGRRRGEPFGTNFSPSIFAHISGPISVIKSFSKQNFKKVFNGGPLTLEFHHSMFKGEDAISKIASFVKSYITLGGHQLQLNAVNLDKLRDAQVNPDKYKNLVVRIWGWSAYFVELDKSYQDHVMKRQEYVL